MPRRLPQPPPEAEVSLSQARRTFPPRPRWFLRYLPRASRPPGGHCCCQLLGWSCQLRSAEASTSSGTLLVLVMGEEMVAAPSLGTCWYSLYLLLAAPAPCSWAATSATILHLPACPTGAPPGPALPNNNDILTRLGIKRKEIKGQIKRTNWKQVPVTKLTEKAFWAQVDEEKMASQSLIEDLQSKFSSKPPGKKSVDEGSGSGQTKKKTKELKVLDPKAAQNLSVILGGALKHISYKDLRKCILRCDTSVLTENLLQSLIQYLPTPDQLNKLQEYGKEYEDLAEAEQFAISLADIKRLVPRLKSLKFQLHYPELVQDCKPDIVAATEACQEVRDVFDTLLRI